MTNVFICCIVKRKIKYLKSFEMIGASTIRRTEEFIIKIKS